MKTRRTIGIVSAAIALLIVGAQPMFANDSAIDGATIQSATAFGADLSSKPYPNEAGGYNAQTCDESPASPCTRVMIEAYGTHGVLKAPKSGTIGKIQLIALDPGSFRLYMVKANPNDSSQYKATRKGPSVSYVGQPDSGPTRVETFNISMHVEKGEQIAVKAGKFSAMRGGSGSNHLAEFQPSLGVGGSYTSPDNEGDFMLIRLYYTN